MRAQFFSWARRVLGELCARPDHLQRVSIIMAGGSLYPSFIGMIVILVVFAVLYRDHQSQIIAGLINYGYIFLGLFALVIISMLGTVKGLTLKVPGGGGLALTTTADDPDIDPRTARPGAMDGIAGLNQTVNPPFYQSENRVL